MHSVCGVGQFLAAYIFTSNTKPFTRKVDVGMAKHFSKKYGNKG